MTSQNQKPRILQGSFEDFFVTDYLKILNDKESLLVENITSRIDTTMYTQLVNELHGVRFARESFLRLLESYFPN